jgi:hypothetical protein
MNRPSVFVIGCRSVGADAAGSVSGRSALGGTCLLCRHEQKQSDDDAGHILAFDVENGISRIIRHTDEGDNRLYSSAISKPTALRRQATEPIAPSRHRMQCVSYPRPQCYAISEKVGCFREIPGLRHFEVAGDLDRLACAHSEGSGMHPQRAACAKLRTPRWFDEPADIRANRQLPRIAVAD